MNEKTIGAVVLILTFLVDTFVFVFHGPLLGFAVLLPTVLAFLSLASAGQAAEHTIKAVAQRMTQNQEEKDFDLELFDTLPEAAAAKATPTGVSPDQPWPRQPGGE